MDADDAWAHLALQSFLRRCFRTLAARLEVEAQELRRWAR